MKYEDLYKEFIALFPEDTSFFDERCKETLAEESDGMHIMFGMVVAPFIIKCVKEDETKARLALDFIEKMEISDNHLISEVAEFSIIEAIIGEGKSFVDKAISYMGTNTQKAIKTISKWYN